MKIKHKTGRRPGSMPKQALAKMLESNKEFSVWPWKTINLKCIKSFRETYYRKALKNLRRGNKTNEY